MPPDLLPESAWKVSTFPSFSLGGSCQPEAGESLAHDYSWRNPHSFRSVLDTKQNSVFRCEKIQLVTLRVAAAETGLRVVSQSAEAMKTKDLQRAIQAILVTFPPAAKDA